ncbi:MAG: extracellular solute-binding protein, partial [Actinomycetota bacterium]|nr:extracellular solute-binding protein [Actinomycetota bacterium]
EQLLGALGAAHRAGIVHRDVKPSNILLDTNGNVKLADFGIAKRLDDLEAALTAAGQFVGTPRYVAPEQAAGQRATAATDLYAVGVVMYEMLSGEAPFDAETAIATLLAHRDAPVPDVRQARPEVPAAMAAAITTAMAKRPEDRFDSAEEMRTALTTSSASSIGTDGGDPAAMNVFPPPPPQPSSTRRPPAWAIFAVAVGAFFVVVAATLSLGGGSDGRTDSTVPAEGANTPVDTDVPGDTEPPDDTEAPDDTDVPDDTEPPDDTEAPSDDLAGTEVTVFGHEKDDDADAMQEALDVFAQENEMTITYVAADDFQEQLNSQVAGGIPPDIAIFSHRDRLRDLATSGDVFPLPDDVLASVSENWDESWLGFWQSSEGTQYGVPNKSKLKSLVWYSPAAFEERGYEVPETLDDFFTLSNEMIANGDTPLCVGIESGGTTGSLFTDWTEDVILRDEGVDYYNQWVTHEVPFNDPPVVEAMSQVAELWATEGAVYAAAGSIAATNVGDNGPALVDGNCMMHRQDSLFATYFPEGTMFGDGEGAIDTFYFPANEGTPVVVRGTGAAAFRDAPEVWAVMEYYGSAEYADNRQTAQATRGGGESGSTVPPYLSANSNVDQDLYSELEQGFLDVLRTGDPTVLDGSDQMPGEVGYGTFRREAIALVIGDTTAQQAADAIEASWPT